MKVLHLIDTLNVGGAEQSLLSILRRFRRVEPVMCHLYPGEALKSAYKSAGIRVISLNIPGRYAFRQAAATLQGVIDRELPDLVHTTLFRADIVGRIVCPRLGVRLVSSFVNDSYLPARYDAMGLLRRLKLRAVQALDAHTARRVTRFVSNSEAIRQTNAKALSIPPRKITVIYRGREPEKFAPVPTEQRRAIRERLGIASGAPLLLNVARLLDRKGHEELIEAFACVRQEHTSASLYIAGEGPRRPWLAQLIAQHDLGGAVKLLGTRDDIPDLLRAADLFVFPSHYEGLPGALVEAMFAARPIVASDIPVHHETVTHGESAWLVPVQNPAALAEAMLWMLARPAEAAAMGAVARATALEKLDVSIVAHQYEDLYLELIAHSHSSAA